MAGGKGKTQLYAAQEKHCQFSPSRNHIPLLKMAQLVMVVVLDMHTRCTIGKHYGSVLAAHLAQIECPLYGWRAWHNHGTKFWRVALQKNNAVGSVVAAYSAKR